MRPYSYQLYSSRNFPPLDRVLGMVSELGYAQVEGYGALYADLADAGGLKASLDAAGLSMPTAHFGLDMLKNDPSGAIDLARMLGITAIFAPHIGADQRPSDAAGWAAFGQSLAELGKPLQDAGLAFGWHNHDFEFADLGGSDKPLDLILAGSDDLRLEFDVAWAVIAGEDPVSWVDRYGDRLLAAHIKDIAPRGECAEEDGWADVGHGVMDWPAIMAALDGTKVSYLIMEHDNPSDDRRFAERSINSARKF